MTAGAANDDLLFVPLGGAGEIGMNLNLYRCAGKWLMVDLGITFADETLPGVEVVMPDPGFIVEHRDDLIGLVLTHAHEDHLGAVPYLWNRLRCPVYATPFAAAVLRRKLARDGTAPGIEDLEITEVPLGGAGEIGMNLNLYGYDGQWLMVDLGITFADDRLPGVDVIMPDPRYIVERREDLLGLVLTHAHEDHLGAVPYLWSRLRCPVYATPFAAAVLRRKLVRDGAAFGSEDMEITEVPLGGRLTLGPFDIELISLTHSIPEPNALAIRTPAGTVLHTGDWKIDPDPVVGGVTDEARLREIGDQGEPSEVSLAPSIQPSPSRSG